MTVRANKWRIYLQFFMDDGTYTGDWVEITDDVVFTSLEDISVDLDNTDFDIGVYRNNSFSLTLRNDHGKYSDTGSPNSVFNYKRSNTQVKVTWEGSEDPADCGTCYADECYLMNEEVLFRGLINDETAEMDVSTQQVVLKVLGRESIFTTALVPYSSLAAGNTVNQILYTILNQTAITRLITVDSSNIDSDINQVSDAVTQFENKSVEDALKDLLLISNSVLYINSDDELIVCPRDPSSSVMHTFYGQASTTGSEDIQSIEKVRSGIARTFNYVTWDSLYAEDASSRAKYGSRIQSLSMEIYTDSTKKQNSINAIRTEFGSPKMEFDLYTRFNYDMYNLLLLDKVTVDYPTVYLDPLNERPICGTAICGSVKLPKALWDFTLSTGDEFKILGKSINVHTGLVRLKLRAV